MVLERARLLLARARAGEFPNETARREAFQTLLPDLIGYSAALDFAGGAESFELTVDDGRLFFDTLYGGVVFEFESSIDGAQGVHARNQLVQYCTQQIQAGRGNIIAVASDVERWRIYDVSDDGNGVAELSLAPNGEIDLSEGELSDQRLMAWVRFTQRLIGGRLREWSENSVISTFGPDSVLNNEVRGVLEGIVGDALGSNACEQGLLDLVELLLFDRDHDGGAELLSSHLYLELLTRVLVVASLEEGLDGVDNLGMLDAQNLNETLNADVFREGAHFGWLSGEEWADRLAPVVESIRQGVLDFEGASCSGVLPLVFQSLMHADCRNWYGQRITPIELVDRVVGELYDELVAPPDDMGEFEANLWPILAAGMNCVLDPSCGTGSFVRAWARRARDSGLSLENVLRNVNGIDIDPAAVTIARATLVEQLADEIQESAEMVRVPIFHGDAVFERDFSFPDQEQIGQLRSLKEEGDELRQVSMLIGNLPWAALSSLPDAPYREDLVAASERLGVREGAGRAVHQNFSTAFALEAARLYLREGGRFGLVLPRDTVNGRAHERFRRCDFRTAESPVEFNVERILDLRNEVFDTLQGTVWFGRLDEGSRRLTEQSVRAAEWPAPFTEDGPRELRYVSIDDTQRSMTSALLYEDQLAGTPEENQYMFREGADVLPLPCFAVDVVGENDDLARIRTSAYARHGDVKAVHNGVNLRNTDLTGRVEQGLLFRFDTSSQTIPFAQRHEVTDLAAMLAAAPIVLDDGNYRTLADAELNALQHGNQWFQRVQNETGRELREGIVVKNKLQYYGNPDGRYVVGYPMSGQNTVGMLIDTQAEERPYLRHQSFYSVCVDDLDEVNYLLGLLNSDVLNVLIRPFQNQGGGWGGGGRHLHTLVRRFIPPYDSENENHVNLANHAAQMRQQVLNNLPNELIEGLGASGAGSRFMGHRIRGERGRVRTAFADEFTALNRLARLAMGVPIEEA